MKRNVWPFLCAGLMAGMAVGGCSVANRGEQRSQFHFTVKAADWPLHATKVCWFFGLDHALPPVSSVGCWDAEDADGGVHNRDDIANDHLHSVDIDLPEAIRVRLSEGHNAKLYCVRTDWTQLRCDQ